MVDSHPNREIMVAVGDSAPDFTLQNSDGSYLSLSDGLEAGSLILLFYRGDW